MSAAAAEPSLEERVAGLADELDELVDELRRGRRCPGCQAVLEPAEPEQQPEERTTAGAAALAWIDQHYPVALAAGDDTEETT